jgi:hypothetical protein
VSEPDVVRLRPRKARVVCGIAAVAVLGMFTFLGTVLKGPVNQGPAVFGPADQIAMVMIGAFAALGVLTFTRPRVEADARGIRVRNLVGGYELPWSAVRAVRFARGAPWASLELVDDDVVAVMAVQATDKEYAVAGVRALRALHAAATAATAEPSTGPITERSTAPERSTALETKGSTEPTAEPSTRSADQGP